MSVPLDRQIEIPEPANTVRSVLVLLCVCWVCLSGVVCGQETLGSTISAADTGANTTASAAGATANDEGESIDLLGADPLKTWKSFPEEKLFVAESTWNLVRESVDQEPVLICNGKSKGFLWTIETYSDFELTAEWKFPTDTDGNSGFLIHTQQEERIWPTSVQIQLHQPKAGSIFPSGDAMTDNILDAPPDLARPINSWNECRVVSRSGRLTIEVNGKRAGEVTGAKPSSGHLALQSEGSEVHFRRLRIRRLSATDLEKIEQTTSANDAAPAVKP